MAMLFTLRVSAERKSPKKYFSYFDLMSGSNPGFSSSKPIHYLLDHGDFITGRLKSLIGKFEVAVFY